METPKTPEEVEAYIADNEMLTMAVNGSKDIRSEGHQVNMILFLKDALDLKDKTGKRQKFVACELPDINKNVLSVLMRTIISDSSPSEYCFVSEAFFKSTKIDSKDEADRVALLAMQNGTKAVSEFEDRKEAILITHGYKDGETKKEECILIEFITHGDSVIFDKPQLMVDGAGGRLCGLWEAEKEVEKIRV
jgi:hypothetical protein